MFPTFLHIGYYSLHVHSCARSEVTEVQTHEIDLLLAVKRFFSISETFDLCFRRGYV